MKKNLFGIFLLISVVISIVLFGIGISLKSDYDNRAKAATTSFVGLPVDFCPTSILKVQPNSQTPLTTLITVTPGQSFKVVVANSTSGRTVTEAMIQVQKPDGTVAPVGASGAYEDASYTVPGTYVFVATISTTCKTKTASVIVSGTATVPGSGVVAPVIGEPTLPGTTGATKSVCASGCDYKTIQDAVKVTPEKGKLYIKNGTYTNNFFFTDQGAKEVTIEGESVDGVIVDGSSNVGSVCNTLTLGKPGGIYVVKNLTIKSSGGCAGISVGGDNNAATNDVNFTADNIKVIGSKGAGVYFKGTSLGKITNSTFTTSAFAGVSVHGNAKVKVSSSTFTGHLTQAIDVKDGSQALFESNTIDNNGTSAIEQVLIANTATAGFKTNIFKNTKFTAFQVKNTAKLISDKDVFDGTTLPKKYIKDTTAEVTLITTTGSSASSQSPLSPSCVAYDFNSDGRINVLDFSTWRPCYQKKGASVIASSGCAYADIVKDNWVNISDFAYLAVAIKSYSTDPTKACIAL